MPPLPLTGCYSPTFLRPRATRQEPCSSTSWLEPAKFVDEGAANEGDPRSRHSLYYAASEPTENSHRPLLVGILSHHCHRFATLDRPLLYVGLSLDDNFFAAKHHHSTTRQRTPPRAPATTPPTATPSRDVPKPSSPRPQFFNVYGSDHRLLRQPDFHTGRLHI